MSGFTAQRNKRLKPYKYTKTVKSQKANPVKPMLRNLTLRFLLYSFLKMIIRDCSSLCIINFSLPILHLFFCPVQSLILNVIKMHKKVFNTLKRGKYIENSVLILHFRFYKTVTNFSQNDCCC